MNKQQALDWVQKQGLRVVARHGAHVAEQTCCVIVRKGVATIERHTALHHSQTHILEAKRQVGASLILGVSWSMTMEQGLYNKLTTEQQAQVDATICGYEYITTI